MENIEAAMKRIPPHSTEAEQAVLGAMLMNKDAITVTSEILAGQDFYQTAYGILFDAMTDLFKSGRPVDLITLQEYLKTKRRASGSKQYGICKRSSRRNSDICQRKILCGNRKKKNRFYAVDQT